MAFGSAESAVHCRVQCSAEFVGKEAPVRLKCAHDLILAPEALRPTPRGGDAYIKAQACDGLLNTADRSTCLQAAVELRNPANPGAWASSGLWI